MKGYRRKDVYYYILWNTEKLEIIHMPNNRRVVKYGKTMNFGTIYKL